MYANIFYDTKKSNIHLWEYDSNGIRQEQVTPFEPYCYRLNPRGSFSHVTSGDKYSKVTFKKYKEQQDFVKYQGPVNVCEGDIQPQVRFLVDNYHKQDLLSNLPQLHIHYIDIEVKSAKGFPQAENETDEILLITVYSNKTKKYHIFGQYDYTPESDNVIYELAKDEKELLKKYIKWYCENYPDIITGWYSRSFDIPYIIDRLTFSKMEFDKNEIKEYKKNLSGDYFERKRARDQINTKLSPVNYVNPTYFDDTYDIGGVTQLDYIEMYKDYSMNDRESYKLNFIASLELGIGKVEFEGSLMELWKTDWKKYCRYNIRDVDLIVKLDDKLSFIELIQMQAYFCRVALEKVASPIRKFDSYLLSLLKDTNKILPTAEHHDKDTLPGGFVAEPRKGYYRYICSFDFTALYPHIMFALNLSPETYVATVLDEIGNHYISIDITKIDLEEHYKLVNKDECIDKIIGGAKLKKFIKDNNLIMSPNGLLFKPKEGFIPKLVHDVFNKRKEAKKIMLDYKKRLSKLLKKQKIQNLSDNKLDREIKECEDIIKKYDLRQNGLKIFANSVFGVFAQNTFRFYSIEFASAITLTGQKLINYVSDEDNNLFKKLFGEDIIATVYNDTDSSYLDYTPFVEKNNITDDKLVEKINEFNEEHINPFHEKILKEFSSTMLNNPTNWFDLKRESIALGGIFIKKKKYAINVLDEEGNTYSEPQLKVKGMEIVRSSTPSFCRDKIKEIVKLMLDTMERKKVVDNIRVIQKEFKKEEIPNISFPRGINNLKKYADFKWPKVGKQCPIQVRAANNYNYLIKKLGLEMKYGLIHEGEKAKYIHIYNDNPIIFDQNVIGFKEVLPEEFGIDEYIDIKKQFEKSFMSPIQTLSETVGWGKISVTSTDLSSIFG